MSSIINVFMCCRNNEDTLEQTFYLLDKIENENKNYSFRYYIYENDSIDKTKTIIINFYKNHKGNCLFETLKNKHWGNIKHEDRVFDMSIYRNKMKNLCKIFNKSEYSIILDTNITFNSSVFQDMINVFKNDKTIHMVTPYGFVEGKPKLYYDTFALDLDSEFNGNNLKKLRYEMKKNTNVKLKSGFAGFIMIQTQTLKMCSWKHNTTTSEHNLFCKEVLKFGNIVCASKIKVKWKK